MSTAERLRQFLNAEMKMNHIYQPVIIKGLLEQGGKVTVQQLANMLAVYLPHENLSDLRKWVSKEPKIVLEKHGLVNYKDSAYTLAWPFEDLSAAECAELISLCEDKIQAQLKALSRNLAHLFTVGQHYSREDIYNLLQLPNDKRNGDWLNGYHKEGDDWFLFVNIGVAGRTAHDYVNVWQDGELIWEGKTKSHLQQPSIQSLLHPKGQIYLFTRDENKSPFTYQGLVEAASYKDTQPVRIRWRLKPHREAIAMSQSLQHTDLKLALQNLQSQIRGAGYHFEPWQIANAVLSLKTKPFAIFAGISGTGKSQLPRLLGDFSGAQVHLIPVRPDWTDSSELLGYTNLQENFVPGRLLKIAEQAQAEPEHMHICVLDEMNLARVEQYFAEVLSLMEDRQLTPTGYRSRNPLHPDRPNLFLGDNLLLVGTVNMDETTHGFSKKVLDRAFTLEMSEVYLQHWQGNPSTTSPNTKTWHRNLWQARALRLAELQDLTPAESEAIDQHIALLSAVNRCLQGAQLQIGYRVRDEFCLYLLHAAPLKELFYSEASQSLVDPVDLALCMKILPRIQGSALTVQSALENLLQWTLSSDQTIEASLRAWQAADRPAHWAKARYPRTASRLLNMLERYQSEGFTSYWL